MGGFGVCHQRRKTGAIYVNRYDFRPRWVPDIATLDRVWQVQDMEGFELNDRPIAYGLLRDLALWIAYYERWVRRTLGTEYQRRTLLEWPHFSVDPEDCASEWVRLARAIEVRLSLHDTSHACVSLDRIS